MELIVSYLIRDTHTLIACSLTCYSWYIAAVPHIHRFLTTDDGPLPGPTEKGKHLWPTPLRNTYKLGLLPFVKRLRIRTNHNPPNHFTPEKLSGRTLRYFSALTNVQELGIDDLTVPSFVEDIQQCFGHFAPTLQFLALKEPRGSYREILYFIGLFPNLQDLKLCYRLPMEERESETGGHLVPLSVPPLSGRLTLTCFTKKKFVEDMITLFGGLRFRCMDLFRVDCVRLLLDACAGTLETLRLYPTDPYGEGLLPNRKQKQTNSRSQFIVDNQAVRSNFDLSRNKSLRTIETTAVSITAAGGAAPGFLKAVLSTITSPLPLDVVITYREFDVGGNLCYWAKPIHVQDLHPIIRGPNALNHPERFKVFSEMYRVREFRLVLCADVLNCAEEYAMRVLEQIVKTEMMNGGLDYLRCEPLIISESRSPRTRLTDDSAGERGKSPIRASAL